MPDDTEERFERTRRRILADLEDAIDACVQPREFHALIGPLVDVQQSARCRSHQGLKPTGSSARSRSSKPDYDVPISCLGSHWSFQWWSASLPSRHCLPRPRWGLTSLAALLLLAQRLSILRR